jgi:predicted alpha/beta-hydrolase family hydrolase
VAQPLILFAHGAGAGSSHPWMQGWRARLETLGSVVTFDYPYMRDGRRSPDRLPKLIDAHRQALADARRARDGQDRQDSHVGPVLLAGKSMGSRVGCHLALEERVDGLVCFGYPLQGMGKAAKLRDEVLIALRTPILFVQGTRDKLCPLDLLADVRGKMQVPSELYVVETGDHSLQATKTSLKQQAETQDDVDDRILAAVDRFVRATAG